METMEKRRKKNDILFTSVRSYGIRLLHKTLGNTGLYTLIFIQVITPIMNLLVEFPEHLMRFLICLIIRLTDGALQIRSANKFNIQFLFFQIYMYCILAFKLNFNVIVNFCQ